MHVSDRIAREARWLAPPRAAASRSSGRLGAEPGAGRLMTGVELPGPGLGSSAAEHRVCTVGGAGGAASPDRAVPPEVVGGPEPHEGHEGRGERPRGADGPPR